MQKLTLLIFVMLLQTSLFGLTSDDTKALSPKQNNATECIDLKKDKKLARAAIEYFNSVPYDFPVTRLVDQSLLNDRDFLMSTSGVNAAYIDKNLRSDRELMIKLTKRDSGALEYASDTLKADKELVTLAVEGGGWSFRDAADSLKDDKDFILGLVKKAGPGIKYYASERLRDDENFMRAGGYNIFKASDRLLKDREFVLEAVKDNGFGLMSADESLKKDKEVVLAAVKNDGLALEFADESLRKDREVVMAAIDQNSEALFVNDFFNDKEIVLKAMSQPNKFSFLYRYIHINGNIEPLDDKKIALIAIKNSTRSSLSSLSPRLQDDKETVLAYMKRGGNGLKFASTRLRDDNDIVLTAINSELGAIEFASKRFRGDKTLILSLIEKNLLFFKFPYLGEELKKDPEVMLAYFKQQPRILEYLDDSFSKQNRALIIETIKKYPYLIDYADESIQKEKMALFNQSIGIASKAAMFGLLKDYRDLRENKAYVMKAISHHDGSLIDNASKEVRENPEVIRLAMKTYGFALKHAPSCPDET